MKDNVIIGWKNIEDFIGLNRETILKYGYTIRQAKKGHAVMALKDELLQHVKSFELAGRKHQGKLNGV